MILIVIGMTEKLMEMMDHIIDENKGLAGGNNNNNLVIMVSHRVRVEFLWPIVILKIHQELAQVL